MVMCAGGGVRESRRGGVKGEDEGDVGGKKEGWKNKTERGGGVSEKRRDKTRGMLLKSTSL